MSSHDPGLDEEEAALLADAMGALAERGSVARTKNGRSPLDLLVERGERGARWLTTRASGLLRSDVHETTVISPLESRVIADQAEELITSNGYLCWRLDSGGASRMRGVIGAGRRVTPSVTTLNVTAEPGGGARIEIRGAAKAGLPGQRPAEQIAKTLAHALGTPDDEES